MTIQDVTDPSPITHDGPRPPLPGDLTVPAATSTLPAAPTATPRVWPPRSAGALTIAWDYGDPACIWLG